MEQVSLKDCVWNKNKQTLTYGKGEKAYIPDTHIIVSSHVSGISYSFFYAVSHVRSSDPIRASGILGFWEFKPEDLDCPIQKLYVCNGMWDGKDFG